MRRALRLAPALAVLAALLVAPPAAAATDYDCGDFQYQEDAQVVFDQAGAGDPYRLDADGDGIACEWLPRRGGPPPGPVSPPKPSYSHNWNGGPGPDIIAARADGALMLYPGNGAGGFQAPVTQIGSGWQAREAIVHAQDWDGGGARDLIARDPSTGNLWLYRGTGSGGFGRASIIGSGWGVFTSIVAPGDWNGDGKPDLLGVTHDGAMRLYPGNGTGGFGRASTIGSGWQARDGITSVGDWDGDGRNDLLAREPATGRLWLYSGNGTGGFKAQRATGSGWSTFTGLVGPGDWDGDGRRDLLARRSNGELWLYPGNGTGGMTSAYRRIGTGWSSMRIAGSTLGHSA